MVCYTKYFILFPQSVNSLVEVLYTFFTLKISFILFLCVLYVRRILPVLFLRYTNGSVFLRCLCLPTNVSMIDHLKLIKLLSQMNFLLSQSYYV